MRFWGSRMGLSGSCGRGGLISGRDHTTVYESNFVYESSGISENLDAVASLPLVAYAPVEPEELRARIAMRIREVAKRRKITLSQLATESGVSTAHLWAVLGGESAATSDVLAKLARVLRVDPDELVKRPRQSKTVL